MRRSTPTGFPRSTTTRVTTARTTTMRTAALTLAAALTLGGCSQGETATFDEPAEVAAQEGGDGAEQSASADTGGTSTGTDTDGPDTTEEDDTAGTSAAAAGIDLRELGEPIATTTVPAVVEDDPEATMEVTLHSLTRDGETLTGIFSFRVDSEGGSEQSRWIYHYLGDTAWTPHLIDTADLARHDVLAADGVRAMTDYQGAKFRPGQTFYAYAAFAAPAAEVETMTVSLVDGAPAVPEVPVG